MSKYAGSTVNSFINRHYLRRRTRNPQIDARQPQPRGRHCSGGHCGQPDVRRRLQDCEGGTSVGSISQVEEL